MSRAINRAYLESDLASLEGMLGSLAPSRWVERVGLENRIKDVRRELEAIAVREGTNAEVVLSFDGGPVAGANGIEVRFATDAIERFQHLVSAVSAKKKRGELSAMGPIPDLDTSRLHISNVVHGSFGFELKEVETRLIESSDLADAVEGSLAVLAAAKNGEESFTGLITGEGERIREAALSFLVALKKRKASVKLVTDRNEVSLQASDIPAMTVLIESTRIEESIEEITGMFGGVFDVTQTFEHKPLDAKAIHGKIDPSLERLELTALTRKLCKARVRVIRTFLGGKEKRPSYVLLGLEPE